MRWLKRTYRPQSFPDRGRSQPDRTAARSDLDHVTRYGKDNRLAGLRAWAHAAAALNVCAAAEHLEGVRPVLKTQALLPLPAMALGRSV